MVITMSTIGNFIIINIIIQILYFIYIYLYLGYGDISPITVYEKIYGIVISFLACGVFAFAVNMIGKNKF